MAAILSGPQCVNTITIQRLYNSKFPLFIPNKPFLISQYMVSWPHIYIYIHTHSYYQILYRCTFNTCHSRVHHNAVQYNDIAHIIVGRKSIRGWKLTRDTPHLALWGEVCGVFYEYLAENWPRYNGTVLHIYIHTHNYIRRTPTCAQRHECS